MQLESDNGSGLFNNDSGQIQAPLEDFHGVPHAGENPHDEVLHDASTVGMAPTTPGYVPAAGLAPEGD